jgi:DNA-directed RNA polymerase subunit RPC12/RpoP
MRFKTRH